MALGLAGQHEDHRQRSFPTAATLRSSLPQADRRKVDSIGFVVRKCPQCSAGRVPLEQIQLSLGHASIQTTERYLGVRQDLHDAPYDRLGLDILAP